MSSASRGSDGPAAEFTERLLQLDDSRIRCFEAGAGKPVVVLHNDARTPSALTSLLARLFRVIIFEIPGLDGTSTSGQPLSPRGLARVLVRATAAAGLDRYALISTSAGAPIALWHAVDAPERIDALVMVSPVSLFSPGPGAESGAGGDSELERKLVEIKAPALLLLGTEDAVLPPETGRMYAERMANCYYVLVYDAGHEIGAERPEALFAAVRDFLERRETFIVSRGNTAINP